MPVTATGVGAEVDTTGKALELTHGTGLGDYTAASTGALLGTTLAEKNGLAVGSTFTVKDQSFTVAGLFDAGTAFGNNALYLTLPTPQTLAELPGELSTMIVTVNSLENVDTAKTALQRGGPGLAGGMPAGGMPGANPLGGASQLLTSVTASASPGVIAAGTAAVFGVAIVGALVPALLTARIRPIEVLR